MNLSLGVGPRLTLHLRVCVVCKICRQTIGDAPESEGTQEKHHCPSCKQEVSNEIQVSKGFQNRCRNWRYRPYRSHTKAKYRHSPE